MAAGFTLSSDGVNPSVAYIEGCENYQKQSWRNRCRFFSASGPQYLTVPVVHEGGTHKLPIREIKVDYSLPWVRQHQRAIVSAYRTSAYFEYYCDELFAIMDSCQETLFGLNMALTEFFVSKIGMPAEMRITRQYAAPSGVCEDPSSPWCSLPLASDYGIDFRNILHPKKSNDVLARLGLEKPYFQVFSPKYGFVSNLSVMDLLFNEGPDSIVFLKKLPVRI